jgi:hypothetical protein
MEVVANDWYHTETKFRPRKDLLFQSRDGFDFNSIGLTSLKLLRAYVPLQDTLAAANNSVETQDSSSLIDFYRWIRGPDFTKDLSRPLALIVGQPPAYIDQPLAAKYLE